MFLRNCLVAIIALLASCKNMNQPPLPLDTSHAEIDSAAIVNDPKNKINILTYNFNEIDSSGILLMPLGMNESNRGDRSSSSYKEIPEGSYWNIVFYNSKTNESHLLSERKMLIKEYFFRSGMNESYDELNKKWNCILYTAIVDDYNKDRKLTEQDPDYLFISDKTGNHFKQISPSNYYLQTWKYIASSHKLIMSATKDTDANSKVNDKDETSLFVFDMDNQTGPTEIFSKDFKSKMKILFDRDWKRLKD